MTWDKPLFPGYVFLFISPSHRQRVRQGQYVANLLDVNDQATFCRQLNDVLKALTAQVFVQLAPEIGPGHTVKIKKGPLAGMSGWVESRYGATTVLLRLDFIGQAAAVNVHAADLERA